MNWLFLKVSSSLCYSNSFPIFLCKYFSDPPFMEGFPNYIVPSNPFPSSTCLPSNSALKYLSYWATFLVFCKRLWLETLFRGLLHINAVRKAAIVHLMRWQQPFPKIFLCYYPFFTHLKSIFVVGISWKITQVKQKLTWLTFVRSKENNPLGLVLSNISLHDHPLWGISKQFLLLGGILISKWGLRPNIKVQAFTPHKINLGKNTILGFIFWVHY